MKPPVAAHKSSGPLVFKESPFYTVLEPLTPIVECKVREQTRDSVELKVMLSQQVAYKLQTDSNLRVMVYCAGDSGLTQYTKSDIAFPHQVELKVNLDEVKANLRGLKNRPGTTQPADVTNWIRKKPNYPNNIVMTYALTQKKFFALANLVKQHPTDDLVSQLKTRKLISKEQVLREMQNRANDSDIVATSSVMSLKCPLSTLRIQVPCRSIVCTHNQCFDASSFLELQKQAPTWTCPVCSKATSFESLQVDQYVDDILQSTSPDIDQVTVEPDGVWSSRTDSDTTKLGGMTPASDDDDDLIEISEPGMPVVKQEPGPTNIALERTPAQSQSREASTPSSAMRMSSKKRPISQVIDLTESGDEDEESPVPPPKRPTSSLPSRAFSRQDYHIPPASSPLNGGSYPP
jgi:E3 SUMO-protein ligase PIAS1